MHFVLSKITKNNREQLDTQEQIMHYNVAPINLKHIEFRNRFSAEDLKKMLKPFS